MNAKKILAMTLATAMVVGSSMTVLADEGTEETSTSSENVESGTQTGAGEVEGYVSTDVFQVVLPTTTDATFAFKMDPQGLIAKTEKEKYGDTADFDEDATVFFATSTTTTGEGEAAVTTTNYTSNSADVTITNKSSMAVDVSVVAKLSNYTGISVTDDSEFTGDTTASLYLALVSGSTTAEITETTEGDGDGDDAVTTASATLTGRIAAANEDAFEYSYDGSKYTYDLIEGLENTDEKTYFYDYTFNMTGASNANGDWSDLTEAAPSVSVVWTITESTEAAPSIATTQYSITSGTALDIGVDLGVGDLAATGITSVVYSVGSTSNKTLGTSYWSYANGTLTFPANTITSFVSSGTTTTAVITFNDTAATSVTVTLTAK